MKEKIALMTDSSCDLPFEMIEEHSIYVLPLKIIYEDQEFRDRVDIQPEEVYRQMPERIPTTAMPSLEDIKRILDNLKSKGFNKVLALHISSGLSGTFDTVKALAREITDMQIEVFDSKALSLGLGFQVYETAKDIAKGFKFHKIIENIKNRQKDMKIFFVLETLEYLKKGGRIGRVAATLGELLNVKPIISIDQEGKYYTFCKARGRKNSIDKLVEIVEKAVSKANIDLAVMHGGAYEEALKLKEKLQDFPRVKNIIFGQISPVLCVHTGPGLIGVSFHENK